MDSTVLFDDAVTPAVMGSNSSRACARWAARHDALTQNPVRALGAVNGRAKTAPRALTVLQLRQLRATLSDPIMSIWKTATTGVFRNSWSRA
ncbi:hypothetical protein [Geodermatophilus sabuli]|uniref:hypothetical protein n=1 Tax=Geodermatophilus sabuli TaxID=1564158 RepID=UPI0015598869|nr:hypothetical protein [Geodermatophilus sabuli]MBB3082463.1 hypothetical protein [Geodermatophilus sabuli]